MIESKTLRGLGVTLAVAMLVVACGGPAATTKPSGTVAPTTAASTAPVATTAGPSGSPAAGKYTLGFSNPLGVGNGFREEQLCTARAEALVSGQVTKITTIHRNTDAAGQASDIRTLIQANPNAIIFNPLDKDALQSAIDEAQTAGIKTVAIDAYVTDPETYNISNDQFNYGYIGASWLFKQLNGMGKVYYMRGIIGHPADADRHAGVMKALAENPGITLLPTKDGVGTNWDPATGTQLITDFINNGGYDTVQGIWTSGIDQQVVDAIYSAHKTPVPVVGADLKGFVEQLLNKSGNYPGLKGLAVYNPASIGGAGVKLALKILNGEAIQTTPGGTAPNTVFLPKPESYDNTTPDGMTKLQAIDVAGLDPLWPVSWSISGWTDYTLDQMLACKGPGE